VDHKDAEKNTFATIRGIFEFRIKNVRRVLNKHGKITTMREVYWECPIEFRWARKDTDIPLVDRTEAHDILVID